MFENGPKLMASALMIAIIGAVCACYSDGTAPLPPADPTLAPPQSSPKPFSFVGTVPIPRIDERAITPTETVGAASN